MAKLLYLLGSLQAGCPFACFLEKVMTALLNWHDKRESILICRFECEFDIENYAVMVGQLPMVVRGKTQRVDVILHLAARADLPPLQGILQEMRIIYNVMPLNFGCFVGFADHFLLSNALSVGVANLLLPRYYGELARRIHVAGSLDEALGKIMRLREAAGALH